MFLLRLKYHNGIRPLLPKLKKKNMIKIHIFSFVEQVVILEVFIITYVMTSICFFQTDNLKNTVYLCLAIALKRLRITNQIVLWANKATGTQCLWDPVLRSVLKKN